MRIPRRTAPSRRRRATPLTVVVLWALRQEHESLWSIVEVADTCDIPYSTAYSVLHRLWSDGLAARVHIEGTVGQVRIWFELTDKGETFIAHVLRDFPDPRAALKALSFTDY